MQETDSMYCGEMPYTTALETTLICMVISSQSGINEVLKVR